MKTHYPLFALVALLCFACEEVAVEEFAPASESSVWAEEADRLSAPFLSNPSLTLPASPTPIPGGTQQAGSYWVIEAPIGWLEGENSDLISRGLEGSRPEVPRLNSDDKKGTQPKDPNPPSTPPGG